MEVKRRLMSEQEAFLKLSSLCATAEYCKADMWKKMERWLIVPSGAAKSLDSDSADEAEDESRQAKVRIVGRLVADRYIDEDRFAHAFVRDKFRYNHWGAVRIAQELRLKRIDASIIEDALGEIDSNDNLDTLRSLINKKRLAVKGKSDYEIRGKLIRFALGRGFDMDDILKVVGD